jgi:hypothetical protein
MVLIVVVVVVVVVAVVVVVVHHFDIHRSVDRVLIVVDLVT